MLTPAAAVQEIATVNPDGTIEVQRRAFVSTSANEMYLHSQINQLQTALNTVITTAVQQEKQFADNWQIREAGFHRTATEFRQQASDINQVLQAQKVLIEQENAQNKILNIVLGYFWIFRLSIFAQNRELKGPPAAPFEGRPKAAPLF